MREPNDLPENHYGMILVPKHDVLPMYHARKNKIKACLKQVLADYHVNVIRCESIDDCLYLHIDMSQRPMLPDKLVYLVKTKSSDQIRQFKSYKGYTFDGEEFWCKHYFIEDFRLPRDRIEWFSEQALYVDCFGEGPYFFPIRQPQTIYEKREAEFQNMMN